MMERVRSQGWGTFSGGKPLFVSDLTENATRVALFVFGIAPILFVAIELSPSAWGLAAPLLLCPLVLAKRFSFPLPAAAIAAAVSLFVYASGLWSIDPPRATKTALNIAAYGIAGVLLVAQIRSLNRDQAGRVWHALVIGCAVAVFVLLAYEIYVALRLKPASLIDHLRTLHKVTLYGFVASAVLCAEAMRRGRLPVLSVLVFAIPALFIGKSSGITLAIFATGAFYLARNNRPQFLCLFAAAFVALAFLAPFIVTDVMGEAAPLGSAVPASFIARLDLWQMVAERIPEAPFFGHGVDSLRVSPWVINGARFYDLPDIPSAHNSAFDVWYDLGVLGVVGLCGAVLLLTRYCLSLTGAQQFLASAILFAIVIEFSVDHRLWVSWAQGFFVFCAAVVALASRADLFPEHTPN
ncbi:O-antigen ligase family protein [Tardiphaga sp. 538_B7_N1_4]|uniref:O-antigen ligase family protein n=1 Tax=Tardiphaga sp. 538_B7_N1_4 TaxID=3240778 RepID=UPI003F27843E